MPDTISYFSKRKGRKLNLFFNLQQVVLLSVSPDKTGEFLRGSIAFSNDHL